MRPIALQAACIASRFYVPFATLLQKAFPHQGSAQFSADRAGKRFGHSFMAAATLDLPAQQQA